MKMMTVIKMMMMAKPVQIIVLEKGLTNSGKDAEEKH